MVPAFAIGKAFTVIVTVFELTVTGDAQVAVEVISQLIAFPFVKPALVYVALFDPVFTPLSFHWYDGVPPFAGVAVKFTDVPAHIGFAEVAMVTEGVTTGFTVMVMVFEVAVGVVGQATDDVITHEIVLPFVSAALVYVALLVPVLVPLSFHWYDGVPPPLTGVAVKVTDVPEQMVVAVAVIETDGTTDGFTVIVIELEVAGMGATHASDEVISQVITFPLVKPAFV